MNKQVFGDTGEGEDSSDKTRLRDGLEDVMMKQAQAQKISDMRACMCEYAPREAITTVGFGA